MRLLLLTPLSCLHCHCTIQTPPHKKETIVPILPPTLQPPPPLREQNPKTEASNTHPDLIPQQKPSDIPPEQMCTEEQRGFLPPFVWEPFVASPALFASAGFFFFFLLPLFFVTAFEAGG